MYNILMIFIFVIISENVAAQSYIQDKKQTSVTQMTPNLQKGTPANDVYKSLSEIEIKEEAVIFNGYEPTKTLYLPNKILDVFSYDSSGKKIHYKEDKDWIKKSEFLFRTTNSTIPDFNSYHYSSKKGCDFALFSKACLLSIFDCFWFVKSCLYFKYLNADSYDFDFISDPRNPPLTLSFNVYVSYYAKLPNQYLEPIPITDKISPNVICMGDSITAGSHTISNFYFSDDGDSWCGLLRQYLTPSSTVFNLSIPGGDIQSVDLHKFQLNFNSADVIIIALGMNDHIKKLNGRANFFSDLDAIVKLIKKSSIKVILVGFFQQNELWSREDPGETLAYNDIIKNVANINSVPFVDIYSKFKYFAPSNKELNKLLSDFMHHPNNYGQRIYFSSIIPFFLKQKTPQKDINNIIYGDWIFE